MNLFSFLQHTSDGTMDFALFMEKYGYKALLIGSLTVIAIVLLGPFVLALHKYHLLTWFAIVLIALLFLYRGISRAYGNAVVKGKYAHVQSPLKKNVKTIEDRER